MTELSKSYGETVALRGVSMTVPDGRMVGFVGRNGSGKTTTMRIVLGVLRADSGEVSFNGSPITAAVRRRFGYMPEERGLYPKMRIKDQLVYLGTLHGLTRVGARTRADHWLERLGVADRAKDQVQTLSLGNQQRVQLAAALVHDPELLVLDEPFSGLDPVGVDVLAAALTERARAGVGVVFSSHQLDLVERLCQDVVILDAGAVRASGTVDHVRHDGRPERYRAKTADDPSSWLYLLPGTRLISHDPASGNSVLEPPPGTDPVALLDAVRSATPLQSFTLVEPSLADLFRAVVAA